MAHLLTVALIVGLLPRGLAGPACAQKFQGTANCIQQCNTKWGYPGMMMGMDAWGSVMQTVGKTIDDWDLYVAKACGEEANSTATADTSDASSTSSSAAEEPTFAHGLATEAVATTSSTTTSTTSSPVVPTSTSSRFVTSSRSTTSTTTSHSTTKTTTSTTQAKPTTEAKPTTTSTTEKPQTTSTTSTHTTAHTTQAQAPENTAATSGGSSSSSSSTSSNSNNDSGNGSRASDADVQAYLTAHNTIRSQHGAVNVVWSNAAAEKAQEWADKCTNTHSGGTLGPLGENLAAGTGTFTIAQAVKAWTDEVSEYNPSAPVASHFTQVVWKATTQIGCAVQTCDGIFAGFGPAQYYVCEYSVQGNVEGEFGTNVQV